MDKLPALFQWWANSEPVVCVDLTRDVQVLYFDEFRSEDTSSNSMQICEKYKAEIFISLTSRYQTDQEKAIRKKSRRHKSWITQQPVLPSVLWIGTN